METKQTDELKESIQHLKKELFRCLSRSMISGNEVVELQARLAIKKLNELERSIEVLFTTFQS